MKSLFLLRHAKSSWEDASLADFDRPLNKRGLGTAPFMGGLMRNHDFQPSVILSSPAERAKQTAILVRESGRLDADVRFDARIYEASPQGLREVVSEIDDTHRSAMIVGHNPGMEGFIRFLTGDLEPMPTAALAVIDLNIDKWKAVDDECGKLQNVFRPKDEIKSNADEKSS